MTALDRSHSAHVQKHFVVYAQSIINGLSKSPPHPEKLHMSLYCEPDCQFQSMPGSQGHLKTCSIYCFRLTARSLRIQKTIIFMLFFLYLEVNGCQETNEAARNSCTSTRRLPCDAEGGIK